MRSLMEKFYSGSPLRRILTVVSLLLFVSAASTIYSFYNLITQLKGVYDSGSNSEIGLENLPEQRGYVYVDEPVRNALAGWKILADLAPKLTLEKRQGKPRALADKVADHDQEIILAVRNFANLDWKYLIIFACPQIDPLDTRMAENFKKIRDVVRFLVLYQRRFSEMHPDESSSFFLAAQLKLGRLNDLSSPFLIGKMITIAIDGLALKGITGLLHAGLLSDIEAAECVELVNTSLVLDKPMRVAMDDEFIFFKHAYGRLYARAPLAMWILETFYGEPFEQYQRTYHEMLANPDYKLELNFTSSNPIVVIAFPNFRKADMVAKEKACQKSIMLATLDHLLGRDSSRIDPWNGQPLKSVKQADKLVFYSVGPNKVDDSAAGDDILLPDYQDI